MREAYKQVFEQKRPALPRAPLDLCAVAKRRLETEWNSAARSNYAKAIDRADQAARMR